MPAFRTYYIHPQVYLWSASQLLRLLGYADEAPAFAGAAQERREEIRRSLTDEVSKRTFDAFVFNRLIETDANVSEPLSAWYLPVAPDRHVGDLTADDLPDAALPRRNEQRKAGTHR